jgi:hypothetical protein
MKKYVFLILICVMFCCCQKQTYSYYDYSNAVYLHTKTDNPKDLKKIMKTYQSIMTKQEKKQGIVAPGLCCDYACLLLESKDTINAKTYFEKEVKLYPESKTYIDSLLKKLGL